MSASLLPDGDTMYRALLDKDPAFDGLFFTGVTTTGVFCRPTCTARKPKRENVVFFPTAHEALTAGYRPCRLCRPFEPPAATPDAVRALLAEVEARPGRRVPDADLRARRIERQLGRLRSTLDAVLTPGASPHLDALERELRGYFAGTLREFATPLDVRGTEFQRRVWAVLREVPYGQTRSYAEQARRFGDPQAIRAVAHANGDNPISIVIPCHRVVGADGSLTGYGGGLWRKRWLLDHERQVLAMERRR